jgi:hypothetical protein
MPSRLRPTLLTSNVFPTLAGTVTHCISESLAVVLPSGSSTAGTLNVRPATSSVKAFSDRGGVVTDTVTGLNYPYTYSDMTGFGLSQVGAPSG